MQYLFFVLAWLYGMVMALAWIFNDESNAIKATLRIAFWPIVAAPHVARGLYSAGRRIRKDAKALMPTQAARQPKQVTVEMLTTDSTPSYEPGRWMKS